MLVTTYYARTGLLFEVDDDQALADCIEMFIGEPAAEKRMVEQAYNLVDEKFEAVEHTRTVLRVFESVVMRGRNRSVQVGAPRCNECE
jgi:hypothetical protein